MRICRILSLYKLTVIILFLFTVSEFTEALAHIYEQHAEEMQLLVSNFRKKNSELRKERPACASSLFHTWETLLQEVEIDSQAHSDIASILGRQVCTHYFTILSTF